MSNDIVARLRAVLHNDRSVELMNREAADEIERLRNLTDKWTQVGIWNLEEIIRLRNQLAARCGDGGAGAHTAGPTETSIPEAL